MVVPLGVVKVHAASAPPPAFGTARTSRAYSPAYPPAVTQPLPVSSVADALLETIQLWLPRAGASLHVATLYVPANEVCAQASARRKVLAMVPRTMFIV